MTETITYNLRNDSGNSNEYYLEIKDFSDEVIYKIEKEAGDILSGYSDFVSGNVKETPRSRGEYCVELLTLGILWRRYAPASIRPLNVILFLLSNLTKIRREYPAAKPAADFLKGILIGNLITPDIKSRDEQIQPDFSSLCRLIRWLDAVGEFKDEVKRLLNWIAYIDGSDSRASETASCAIKIFDWFEAAALTKLGKYTSGVENFLQNKHIDYRFREDEIYTGKSETEYHLNMVGAEIMNRGFSSGFKKAEKFVLLVPGCMRGEFEETCKAFFNGEDIECRQCRKNCRINEITKLGKDHSFRVCIVPHSSGFTKWLERWQNKPDTGIIAAACLLNLVPGGYEMRELNLNAQCILLDYCGCRKHWHKTGIATELNPNQLLKILN